MTHITYKSKKDEKDKTMKLFNSIGPNPRVVRMFVAEKGIDLPMHDVDLMSAENRQPEYVKLNPTGTTPALELDNGDVVSEIIPICEYLEEHNPQPALIGETPEQRVESRMWTRRIDLNLVLPMTLGFRYGEGKDFFKDRVMVIPEASEGMKALAQNQMQWLDQQMEGKRFVCGDRFTLADILLFSFLDFGSQVGQSVPEELEQLQRWFDDVKQRPSVEASAQ